MPREKISLIMTIFNERATVDTFFQTLKTFTRLPDEVVIVDGGSNDGTLDIIRQHLDDCPAPVNLIEEQRCNIPRGRNIAIENARYDILACTDMGCVIAPDWLEKIVAPFEADPAVDAVGGYYEPLRETPLHEAFHHLTWKDTLKEGGFLPSHRSIAYRRKVWEGVGRYPEHLQTAEDTLFDQQILAKGFRMVNVPEAKVYWESKNSCRQFFILYFRYARGEGRCGIHFLPFLSYAGNFLGFGGWLVLAVLWHPVFLAALAAHLAGYAWFRIFRKPLVRREGRAALVPLYFALICSMDTGRIGGYLFGIGRRLLRIEDGWLPAADKEARGRQ
jgi:glycosyltransferase involved in cell wall biosynthesis